MVTQNDLRDRLRRRLQEIALELQSYGEDEGVPEVYISEIFGDKKNALYRILDFPTNEKYVKYLSLCDYVHQVDNKNVLKTKPFKAFTRTLKTGSLEYHRPQIKGNKIHVLVLRALTNYSGTIQERLFASQMSDDMTKANDDWACLIQDFEELYDNSSQAPRNTTSINNRNRDPASQQPTPTTAGAAPPTRIDNRNDRTSFTLSCDCSKCNTSKVDTTSGT
jgi:hypothetical protein